MTRDDRTEQLSQRLEFRAGRVAEIDILADPAWLSRL
jgi:hypothetical protein